MNIDNLDLKLKALEDAISYPSFKEVKDTCIVEVESFNYDDISKEITSNEKLTNLEGAQINLILEILKLLNDNKIKYNVVLHNNIGFYWRGLPILVIRVTGGKQNQERMMYISVKVYKDEYSTNLGARRAIKYTVVGFAVVSVLAVGLGALFFTKKNSN